MNYTSPLDIKQSQIIKDITSSLEKARTALEMVCAYTSILEKIDETNQLKGLHELHVYGYFPMSYHMLTATGASRIMEKSNRWDLPLGMLIYGCSQNILDYLPHVFENYGQIKEDIENLSTEFQDYVEHLLDETSNWGQHIQPSIEEALNLLESMLDSDTIETLKEENNRIDKDNHLYRIYNRLNLTSTVGEKGLSLI